MPQRAPNFSILLSNVECPLEELDCLRGVEGLGERREVEERDGVTLGKSSRALAMEATWVRARSDSGLWRRACSYADSARSGSFICSARLPATQKRHYMSHHTGEGS